MSRRRGPYKLWEVDESQDKEIPAQTAHSRRKKAKIACERMDACYPAAETPFGEEVPVALDHAYVCIRSWVAAPPCMYGVASVEVQNG